MSSHVLTNWEPENRVFWEKEGKEIASRNLWVSIPALLLAFSVWMVWSMVVVNLSDVGFKFDNNQLFWLAALPGLSGATLRLFYSFMVPIFGGRKWTTISTASLLLPAVGIGFAVQDPTTTFTTFVILALLCGFGGGNFSSSMANINFFFPQAQKGMALGMNAGLGNLGVSVMQFLVPLAITAGIFGALGGDPQTWVNGDTVKKIWLQNAGFIWVPFIIASTLTAWLGMNDIVSARASFREHVMVLKDKHTWLMSWLYLGTFGSFIGFSAGLPLLIKSQFQDINPTQFAFLGPLVGALIRPLGGWMSDKLGGASVTLWNFIVMAGAISGAIYFLPVSGVGGNFWGFLAMFILLFLTAGIGNGSTFSMIPAISLSMKVRVAKLETAVSNESSIRASAMLGFSSAIAAYGAFFIPKSLGTSIAITGGTEAAMITYLVFYATCIAITWWYYARKDAPVPC